MSTRIDRFLKFWERQHSASEKRFASALEKFFLDQAGRIARAVAGSPHLEDGATSLAKIVNDAFKVEDEHKRFMQVASAWLLRLMVLGAELENANAPKAARPTSKAIAAPGADDDSDAIWNSITFGDVIIDVPPQAMARIRTELMQIETQPYWQGIQATTKGRVADAIGDGIRDGLSQRDLVAAVRERLSEEAKERALLIARTETTGALNAGHHAMRQELVLSGHVKSEEWVALIDGATRLSHSALSGTHIRAGEQFNVGGELAPYPGWWGLSAAERANCRCTTIAGSVFADE